MKWWQIGFRLLEDEAPGGGGGGNLTAGATIDKASAPHPDAPPAPGQGDMVPDKGAGRIPNPAAHEAKIKSGLKELFKSQGIETPGEELEQSGDMGDDKASRKDKKSPEKVAEAKPAEKPAAPKPGETKPADKPSDRLAKLEAMEPPGNMSDAGKKNWNELKKHSGALIRDAEQAAAQANRQLKEAQEALAASGGQSKAEIERLRGEVETLKGFRAAVDLQSEPEFQEKYVKPMGKAKDNLVTWLKGKLKNPESVDAIDFDDEMAVEAAAVALEGETGAGRAIANLFRQKAAAYQNARVAHDEELSNLKSKGGEILKNRQVEASQKQNEFKGKVSSGLKSLRTARDEEGKPTYPILNVAVPPEGAKPEMIEKAEAWNREVEQRVALIEHRATAEDPDTRLQSATMAAVGEYLLEHVPVLQQKIKELEAELGKKQSSRSFSPGGGGAPITETKTPEEEAPDYKPGKGVPDGAAAMRKQFGNQR